MENWTQQDLIGFRERTAVFGQQKNQQSSKLLSFLVESLALEFSSLKHCLGFDPIMLLSLFVFVSGYFSQNQLARLFLFPQSNS